jgi:hypothetical protein
MRPCGVSPSAQRRLTSCSKAPGGTARAASHSDKAGEENCTITGMFRPAFTRMNEATTLLEGLVSGPHLILQSGINVPSATRKAENSLIINHMAVCISRILLLSGLASEGGVDEIEIDAFMADSGPARPTVPHDLCFYFGGARAVQWPKRGGL